MGYSSICSVAVFLFAVCWSACKVERPYISNSDICEFDALLSDHFPEILTQSTLSNIHYINTLDPEYQRMEACWAKGDYLTYPMPPPPMIPHLSYKDLKRYGELGCLSVEEVNYYHQKLLHLPKTSDWQFSKDVLFPLISFEELKDRIKKNDSMFFQFRRCSIPLFTPNRQRVLFFIEYMGNGGSGWIYTFQKVGEDWQEIYSEMTWIS